jgi:hypothetical protein
MMAFPIQVAQFDSYFKLNWIAIAEQDEQIEVQHGTNTQEQS